MRNQGVEEVKTKYKKIRHKGFEYTVIGKYFIIVVVLVFIMSVTGCNKHQQVDSFLVIDNTQTDSASNEEDILDSERIVEGDESVTDKSDLDKDTLEEITKMVDYAYYNYLWNPSIESDIIRQVEMQRFAISYIYQYEYNELFFDTTDFVLHIPDNMVTNVVKLFFDTTIISYDIESDIVTHVDDHYLMPAVDSGISYEFEIIEIEKISDSQYKAIFKSSNPNIGIDEPRVSYQIILENREGRLVYLSYKMLIEGNTYEGSFVEDIYEESEPLTSDIYEESEPLTSDIYEESEPLSSDSYEETELLTEDIYEESELFKGRVVEIVSDKEASTEISGAVYGERIQVAKVELLNKGRKGEIIEITSFIDEIMAYSIEINVGDNVYIFFEKDDEGNEIAGHIYGFRRDKDILYLIVLFTVLMVILGGFQGIKSLVTLGLTILGVYCMLIGIVAGYNPIFLSIGIAFIITIMTMFIVAGFNLKAISAIAGTFGGVIIAGVLALIVSKSSNLTGLGDVEAQMLLYSGYSSAFNIYSILFASILLGTLGAVMDVCMSIASAIKEVIVANPILSKMALFKSGMNIGRDIMGTMVNTLILAYVGTSVFLVLIFMVNDVSITSIINMDLVATEIVRALTGTIGLICAIPITAIVSAILESYYSQAN